MLLPPEIISWLIPKLASVSLWDVIPFVLSGISILGATYNALGRRAGFYIWIVANLGWIVFNYVTKTYGQIPMWLFYIGICALGLSWWKRKGVGK